MVPRSDRRRARTMLTAAVLGLVVVGLIGAWIGLQRRVIYPRPQRPEPPQLPAGAETVWLGQDREIESWFLRPPASTAFPVVIFMHGNGELIDHHVAPLAPLTRQGVGVLLVEYPGYGRSGGSPNERSITAAVVAAFDYLSVQPEVDRERIVAYGRSIGGGAACAMAAVRPVAALVLESTFTRLAELMPPFVPRALMLDRFDNIAIVASGTSPVLVLHGDRDRIIPYAHAEALAQAAGTTPVAMPCGHNDCPAPLREILRFLGQHRVLSERDDG